LGGKLIFHIFGALAEFERDIIQERTQAGLQAARARGRNGGRPKLLGPRKLAHAQALYNDKTTTSAKICKNLGFSHATLYRSIQIRQEESEQPTWSPTTRPGRVGARLVSIRVFCSSSLTPEVGQHDRGKQMPILL
jgi:DNA invertase Pin-like site-specific DNA recombinase